MPDCALLVFAKAPQPGKVKTRLSPLLGDEICAQLHATLVRHTLATLCSARRNLVELWCSPDNTHPFFKKCQRDFNITLTTQSEGSLGTRMYRALSNTLERHKHVVIVGTDCPTLDYEYLDSAFMALRSGQDIVIGPALDGGYVLLGTNKLDSTLFDDIQWGTDTVLGETLNRLEALNWNVSLLPELMDIDTPQDFHTALMLPAIAHLLAPFVCPNEAID